MHVQVAFQIWLSRRVRVKLHSIRIGRLMTGAAALAAFVPAAHAQEGTPSPAPRATPTPSTRGVFLPGAENFSLPGSPTQPARPTPAPTAAAPTPVRATPTPRPTPTPAAARPTPAPTSARQPAAVATPTPTPAARPTPLALPTPTVAQPQPTVAETPVPVATPAPAPAQQGGVPWLWILTGAAMASLLVVLGWLLGRRRRPVPRPEPVAAPPPPAVIPPRAPMAPPPPAPRPAQRPAMPPEPVAVELRPIAIDLTDSGAVFEFELVVGNATVGGMDGMRVAYGLMSASEQQDELSAAFHASQLPPVADPFDLASRSGVRIPGKVGLSPERIYIVTVGGRPMFVPILLIDLRWRSGLNLRHQSSDFMIGIGGQGEKLGPIWLDKGAQRHTRLNASRYYPKPVTAAAE